MSRRPVVIVSPSIQPPRVSRGHVYDRVASSLRNRSAFGRPLPNKEVSISEVEVDTPKDCHAPHSDPTPTHIGVTPTHNDSIPAHITPTHSGATPTQPTTNKAILKESVNETSSINVIRMTSSTWQRRYREVEEMVGTAGTVCLTLKYTDNTTLLRDASSVVKGSGVEVQYMCIGMSPCSTGAGSTFHCIMIEVQSITSQLGQWTRVLLCGILEACTIISYNIHCCLMIIIEHYAISINSCRVLDVGVAHHLLQPEAVPSYDALLALYNIHTQDSSVQDDLCTMPPLMAVVTTRLKKEGLWELFVTMEMQICALLANMETNGVFVNRNKLLDCSKKLEADALALENKVYQMAGHTFPINSTQKLREVLFLELKLDQLYGKKLPKTSICKLPSTSEAVLSQLQHLHPLPSAILEYRQVCKLKSYIDNVFSNLSQDGVLRPAWHHMGTVTGRLTSSNPWCASSIVSLEGFLRNVLRMHKVKITLNLDFTVEYSSIPKVVIDVREAIQCRPGYTLVGLDFKSIELRLLAHFSQDASLLRLLAGGDAMDVFKLLASQWLGMSPEHVTSNDREKTKRVVYSVIYGMGKEKLSEVLQTTPSTAGDLITDFLGRYPGVKAFAVDTIRKVHTSKWCSTLCGRKRWFYNISSTNNQARLYAERQAVNFVIQGSAADVCKVAMIKLHHYLASHSTSTKLLLQVHDELVYEVRDEELSTVTPRLKHILESPDLLQGYSAPLKVPLEVKVSKGLSWSSLYH